MWGWCYQLALNEGGSIMKLTLLLQTSQKLTSYLEVASMVVLKGIPSVLSPELLYALAKMGHGDELGMFFFKTALLKSSSCRVKTI